MTGKTTTDPQSAGRHAGGGSLPLGADAANVMLSASGRRVALMRLLQDSLVELGVRGGVLATDITRTSPAMQLAADSALVPPYRDPQCLPFLLDLCRRYAVRLIVPTIDPELGFYARHAQQFRDAGCRINVSSAEAVEIGADKQRTHEWLLANGFPTVRQTPLERLLADGPAAGYPLIVKPRRGSSSVGLTVASAREQLEARAGEKDLIVQSLAKGTEYTVDVFVDRGGSCRCAVPRRRLETRAGEVSKGVTARNEPVAALARRIAQALPGVYGVLNVQIFHDPGSDELAVIEINPRFGGGYPLSHQAGAPMARWLLEDVLDLPSTARDDQWRPGLVMLRYDEAAFVDQGDAGVN